MALKRRRTTIRLVLCVAAFFGTSSHGTAPADNPATCATICLHSLPDWWRLAQATPSAALLVHETNRVQMEGKTAVRIGFEMRGVPPDKRYEFWTSSADGLTVKIWDLAADPTGRLAWLRKDGSFGPQFNDLRMTLPGFVRGERMEFALVSTDRTIRTFAKFIPFPIEARQGRCHISLELLTPTTFLLHGEGFEPGEEVVGISRSDGEVIEDKLTASVDGTIGPGAILPAAISRLYKANITVRARSCSVSLDYAWGPAALVKQ